MQPFGCFFFSHYNAASVLKHHTPHTHTQTHTLMEQKTGLSQSIISNRLWQEAVWWIHYANVLCRGLFQRAAPVPHDQICDVALKSSLHEWMNVSHTCRHTHRNAHVHMRDSRLCLNKFPLLSSTPRLHIQSKYLQYAQQVELRFPCLDLLALCEENPQRFLPEAQREKDLSAFTNY